MFEYSTAIHIHSVYSDGSGQIPDIAKYASEVGLDIIMMTDHDTLAPKTDGFEKWIDNTFVIIGTELEDSNNKNHFLAFNIDELPYSKSRNAKDYLKKTLSQGGYGFVAHPFEKRNHMAEHPPYPWTCWDCKDFLGIEIWNHMSEWMEGLTEQNKYQRFVHPLKSILSPPAEALVWWDKLALERPVVGIAGVDAHGHKHNLLGFFEVEIFPYKVLFKSLRTHILCSGELKKENTKEALRYNKSIINEAFLTGRVFFGNYSISDIRGFRFLAENKGKTYQCGETIPEEVKDLRLRVSLPFNSIAKIKLIRNGKVIDSVISSETMWKVTHKGVYRVTAELDDRPWIFSNHIRFL